MNTHFIAIDLVKVFKSVEKKKDDFLMVLVWGDEVEVIEKQSSFIKLSVKSFKKQSDGTITAVNSSAFIRKGSKGKPKLDDVIKPLSEKNILKVAFVDVQQGDGCVIETPKGKVMLLDGGENTMFARYLAARFSGTSADNPKDIECIIVSHGDADHFSGLPEILKSEQNETPKKRLFINPKRMYHNGIIKRPTTKPGGTKRKDIEMLGATVKKGKKLFITGLESDFFSVKKTEMNKPFQEWQSTLKKYRDAFGVLETRRLDNTSEDAFDFLKDENIEVKVLGPIVEKLNRKPALTFLRQPTKSVAIATATDEPEESSGAFSASHTINGHSIILRMKYGNISFLFAGDLNEEAEDMLVENAGAEPIQSEILKVPHHGSADFSNRFFDAVKPVISVVSSGDESEVKEFIHPRATLVGALGKHSRIERPIIFITELVAFFKKEGMARVTQGAPKNKKLEDLRQIFAFSRTSFGIVHVRTDGKKLFVFTHSGQRDLKETYSFIIESEGAEPVRQNVVSL